MQIQRIEALPINLHVEIRALRRKFRFCLAIVIRDKWMLLIAEIEKETLLILETQSTRTSLKMNLANALLC